MGLPLTAPRLRLSDASVPADGRQRPAQHLHFVVVGAYVLDCLVDTSRIPGWGEEHEARSVRTSAGGKALNQAVALARIGARVSAVGVVGDDGAGHDILSALTREGVGTTVVEVRTSVSSAVCVCFVGDDGDNAILWHVDDDVAVTPATLRNASAVIRQADAVLITFEMPQESIREAITIAKDSGAMVIVEPAPRWPLPRRASRCPGIWRTLSSLTRRRPARCSAASATGSSRPTNSRPRWQMNWTFPWSW